MNTLSEPDFNAPLERAMYTALPITMLIKHFPIIKVLLNKLPPKLLEYLQPEMKGYLDMLEARTRLCMCSV